MPLTCWRCDGVVSADVTASIANDATMLPAGSAIVVDDFHYAADSAARDMIALVERCAGRDRPAGLVGSC